MRPVGQRLWRPDRWLAKQLWACGGGTHSIPGTTAPRQQTGTLASWRLREARAICLASFSASIRMMANSNSSCPAGRGEETTGRCVTTRGSSSHTPTRRRHTRVSRPGFLYNELLGRARSKTRLDDPAMAVREDRAGDLGVNADRPVSHVLRFLASGLQCRVGQQRTCDPSGDC